MVYSNKWLTCILHYILQDGHPPLGWHDTAAYLVLPVLLVVSQYVSMEIMKPPQVGFHIVLFSLFLLYLNHFSCNIALIP